MGGMSSEEEDLDLEAQLNSLNKPPVKTIQTSWGDLYDCIEFHKQPAFDHPLLKKYKHSMREEMIVSKKSDTMPMSGVDGCPKGTVPIRRTSKEDLIRAKSLSVSSPLSSSNPRPGVEYRAGVTYLKMGEAFNGARGIVSVWNPKVNQDQFSSAEMALKSGPQEQTSAIKFGWTVNPQLYGDNMTRTFAYWTGDGGHKTGCYNTLCKGFVQVHQTYTPVMFFQNTSQVRKPPVAFTVEISREPGTGKWWLMIEKDIKIGYWAKDLFPLFRPGVEYIYWGGRVKSGKDGVSPAMTSGINLNRFQETTGFFDALKLKDKNDHNLEPVRKHLEDTIDCPKFYGAKYWADNNIVLFSGRGGGTCV
ncbi:hypothetical protein C5167_014968 [Papaver somniferum]|uniref:Neprosin PEP catalytic domain-containing protein n=2 Tax=Papaver somniferum TaxID=3469 RepID=A0A4Y7J6L8_PAPSO|nr:hypothetical protein C5167_014968 [Papaver somniferum]